MALAAEHDVSGLDRVLLAVLAVGSLAAHDEVDLFVVAVEVITDRRARLELDARRHRERAVVVRYLHGESHRAALAASSELFGLYALVFVFEHFRLPPQIFVSLTVVYRVRRI